MTYTPNDLKIFEQALVLSGTELPGAEIAELTNAKDDRGRLEFFDYFQESATRHLDGTSQMFAETETQGTFLVIGEWPWDEDDPNKTYRLDAVLTGYPDRRPHGRDEMAMADVLRIITRPILMDPKRREREVTRATGWGDTMILLLEEKNLVVRVSPGGVREAGSAPSQGGETPAVLERYAEAVEELREELLADYGRRWRKVWDAAEERLGRESDDTMTVTAAWAQADAEATAAVGDPILAEVVAPWLMREAATARLELARRRLHHSFGVAGHLIGQGEGKRITMSALARGLRTDRSNLHKTINSAES